MSVHPRRHHAPPCSPDNCRLLPGAEIKALPSPKYALTQLRRRSGAKEPGGAPVQSSARPSPEQPRPSPRAPQTPGVGAFPAPTARGSPHPAAPTPPPQVGRAVSHRAAPAQRSVPRGASSSCCQAPTAVPTTPRPPLPCLQRSAATPQVPPSPVGTVQLRPAPLCFSGSSRPPRAAGRQHRPCYEAVRPRPS